MGRDKVFWIEVTSAQHTGKRVAIQRIKDEDKLNLTFEAVKPPEKLSVMIKRFGAKAAFNKNDELEKLIVEYSPGLVAQAIYYLYEEVFSNQRVYILKFKY
jgi:hypothetical protein